MLTRQCACRFGPQLCEHSRGQHSHRCDACPCMQRSRSLGTAQTRANNVATHLSLLRFTSKRTEAVPTILCARMRARIPIAGLRMPRSPSAQSVC